MTKMPMYFIRKLFRGAEACYQKIEKFVLVVVAVRKLISYFQSHKILVKTNYLIRQVLKKLDLERRMVSGEMELLEYEI